MLDAVAQERVEQVSGKSTLAGAIRYALRHWPGLVLFLDDSTVELDNNTVERAIRPIALGRKNSLMPARMAEPGTGRSWRAWWRARS